MGGRSWLCSILGVCAALLGILFAVRGYEQAWELWGVPVMTPHFGDARVITAGLESIREGWDPLLDNRCDPWLRPMNYPRIWRALVWLGLDQRHTTALGLLFIGTFTASLVLLSDGIRPLAVWLMALSVFSPAVMFGIERANNDLLMFFILALAVRVVKRKYAVALALVGAGAALKLYPFFGIALLLRAPRRWFLRAASGAGVVMLLYTIINSRDLYIIRELTPQSIRLSYGSNMIWMSFKAHFGEGRAAGALTIGTYIALVAICLTGIQLGRYMSQHNRVVGGRHLDAFRTGSAVYLGSFVLFTNWDYRLIFLLFTIPQLSDWACEAGPAVRWIARIALVAIVLATWSLGLHAVTLHIPNALPLWFLVDQGAKWIVFTTLLFAFTCSLPEWFFTCSRQRHVPLPA